VVKIFLLFFNDVFYNAGAAAVIVLRVLLKFSWVMSAFLRLSA